MQERQLFEYAVIRIVPRVEREEFLNAGVILYCRDQKFLGIKFSIDRKRLQALYADIDIADVENRLNAFSAICAGSAEGGPIAKLDMASRFRWLIANRSTILQASPVHPGLCKNAEAKLDQLFEALVL